MSSPTTTEPDRGGPRRGDLYVADPGPTVGHEQAGRRPYLVVSTNQMSRAPVAMVIAVPLTTTPWSNPVHVRIEPAESGLPRVSYAMPEMARSFSALRFSRRVGRVTVETVDAAARHTGLLIGLGRRR
jgi:mRNA interferase MazF